MSDGQLTRATFNERLIAQVRRIRSAEDEYRAAIGAWVDAERNYRRAQALAITAVEDYRNAAERDAKAELMPLAGGGTVNDLRREAHMTEALVNACKLSLQARMAELSALQSEASLAKEEARFIRTEPEETRTP